MDKLIQMDTMMAKDGPMTVLEWGKRVYNGPVEVYRNSTYQVVKREMDLKEHGFGCPMVWLSIKRIDRQSLHDWRDLQEIKNQLVGRYCEGMELYPTESRKVDTSNQYHLWVFKEEKNRFPIGFTSRMVATLDETYADGARQRKARQSLVDYVVGKFKIWKSKREVAK